MGKLSFSPAFPAGYFRFHLPFPCFRPQLLHYSCPTLVYSRFTLVLLLSYFGRTLEQV